MKGISIEIRGASKNATVNISGILTKDVEWLDIFTLVQLNCEKVRFESVVFSIQEKAGFYLWWQGRDLNKTLILPLESRGAFNFEAMQFLHSPPGTERMGLSSFGVDKPKAFLLILDLGKQ